MICNYCKKEFIAKRFRKYCTIECRKKQIVKTRNQRQKENLPYPNANQVDKIILDHDASLVSLDNDWVFSKLLSDWCSSKNTTYRSNDRERYRNGKKKKGNT